MYVIISAYFNSNYTLYNYNKLFFHKIALMKHLTMLWKSDTVITVSELKSIKVF